MLARRARARSKGKSCFISDLEKNLIVCEIRGFRSPPRGRLGVPLSAMLKAVAAAAGAAAWRDAVKKVAFSGLPKKT